MSADCSNESFCKNKSEPKQEPLDISEKTTRKREKKRVQGRKHMSEWRKRLKGQFVAHFYHFFSLFLTLITFATFLSL